MPARSPRIPKYRHYRPKNLAVVRINGRDHYLGRFGSEESQERYRRLIAEWLTTNGTETSRDRQGPTTPDVSVNEVLLAYWRHTETHYRRPDGSPGQELANVRDALRPLKRLYGHTPARDFGPLALRAVRDEMVRTGLSRTTINARVNRIRRAFRWAASMELVPPAVYQAISAVEGLRQGRTEAKEAPEVGPVPLERVQATLPHLPAPVAAMVRLQLLTGMRAGEVMAMRGCDLVEGEPTWEYRPATHKNAWRGQERIIPLGPQAQEVLRGFRKPDPAAFLFSPREVVEQLRAERKGGRPAEAVRDRYDRRAYRQAIARACDRAFPHPTLSQAPKKERTAAQERELKTWRREQRWSPLQLRHTAATAIRARYGLEAAQAVLGHARADTTQIYAERDQARARSIMEEMG